MEQPDTATQEAALLKPKIFIDPQTGDIYPKYTEGPRDFFAAYVSLFYSVGILPYLCRLLLDTWTETYAGWPMSAYKIQMVNHAHEELRILICAAIGGGIGASVNNIRSFVLWHSERQSFGWRFVWKYLSMPPLGATLAVIVNFIIQGGVAVFASQDHRAEGVPFSALATGALAGYASSKVLICWTIKPTRYFGSPHWKRYPRPAYRQPPKDRPIFSSARITHRNPGRLA